ncbi:MAG: 3-hydroxyacyl-CoA dehydrogenase NAD-binding domain-containing protein, partial [Ferruginibacter sp.]
MNTSVNPLTQATTLDGPGIIKVISVIGSGTMGNGIAHLFAQAGYKVNLVDINSAQLEKAVATIGKNLDRQIARGTLDERQKESAINNLTTFTSLAEGVQTADLVIEAAT